jgi:hypothetical protein
MSGLTSGSLLRYPGFAIACPGSGCSARFNWKAGVCCALYACDFGASNRPGDTSKPCDHSTSVRVRGAPLLDRTRDDQLCLNCPRFGSIRQNWEGSSRFTHNAPTSPRHSVPGWSGPGNTRQVRASILGAWSGGRINAGPSPEIFRWTRDHLIASSNRCARVRNGRPVQIGRARCGL